MQFRMRMSTSNCKQCSFRYKGNEIPSQKGEHSCKCTELSLKRNKRIFEHDYTMETLFVRSVRRFCPIFSESPTRESCRSENKEI